MADRVPALGEPSGAAQRAAEMPFALLAQLSQIFAVNSTRHLRGAFGGLGMGDVIATGSTTPRSLADRFAEVVNVKDYGALGDYDPIARTGTDDTAAFNTVWSNAIAAAKTLISGPSGTAATSVTIRIPAGFYRINGSINWADTRIAQNIHVIAYGAVLFGRHPTGTSPTSAKPVVDMIGTRWAHINGLTIFGDATDTPRCGIQIGRYSSAAVGNNVFRDVTTLGFYTLAGFYNVASETTQFLGCRFHNNEATNDTFAYIGDGRNHWTVASDHVTVSISQPQEMSFTNNYFGSCEFRHWGGFDSVWLAHTSGHYFNRGCYFLAFDDSNVRIYLTSASVHRNLTLNGHFESGTDNIPAGLSPANVGVLTSIEIEGDTTAAQLDGLKIDTHVPHCKDEFIRLTNTGNITIAHADISVMFLNEAGANFFGGAGSLRINGRIQTTETAQLNLSAIARFNGDLVVGDLDSLDIAPVGHFTARGVSEAYYAIDGVRDFAGDAWLTATHAASPSVLTVFGLLNTFTAAGETVTDVDWATNINVNGLPFIVIRNASGSGSLTFTFNASKIRTITGASVTVGPRESITFVPINDTIVQQIAGSV